MPHYRYTRKRRPLIPLWTITFAMIFAGGIGGIYCGAAILKKISPSVLESMVAAMPQLEIITKRLP
jgi:uncharacterized membrane protein YfcA